MRAKSYWLRIRLSDLIKLDKDKHVLGEENLAGKRGHTIMKSWLDICYAGKKDRGEDTLELSVDYNSSTIPIACFLSKQDMINQHAGDVYVS